MHRISTPALLSPSAFVPRILQITCIAFHLVPLEEVHLDIQEEAHPYVQNYQGQLDLVLDPAAPS